MITKKVSISVGENESISGVLSVPKGYQTEVRTGIIIAHGAGNDMEHPFIVSLAEGLSEAGYLTLRFNFLYKEKGRKAPDPLKKLILTWQSVYQFLQEHPNYGTDNIIAAGKSMGGRVASQIVDEGLLPAKALIFFGYPLHPPGKKDKLRDSHLYGIKIPMLFFAGTRDSLCNLEQLKSVLKRLDASWKLEIVTGGDHSFVLPKSSTNSQQEVYRWILEKTINWLATIRLS